MCHCANLRSCEEALPTRELFVVDFEPIEPSVDGWSELFLCNDCGQHWIVERGAEMDRRSNKAYKIEAQSNWQTFDRKPALADLLIQKHGGLAGAKCAFVDCPAQALRGMAVCVRHGHSEYVW